MRTDAIIDKQQVPCPNTSHIGYDKRKAQVGDIVNFTDTGTGPDGKPASRTRVGRMIGRIKYAPALSGDKHAIRNYILVVALAEDLTYTSEFWVNPADVTRVQSMRNHREILDWFISDLLTHAPIEEVRRAQAWGGGGLVPYRAYMAQRAKEQADFEAQHAECNTAPCDFCRKFRPELSEAKCPC